MASFGSDFGQKVDLTASIRNILRNYPEGTAVLKELIQNADDAGAKNVSFCLDCRNHSTISLAHPDLQQFQGPALVVYNDAIFTEQDFQSIQRIGDSLKKNDESKTKIGRFGIGFNAVYHWTELPSFMSSEYLVMLDPQARFLPNVNPSNPGKIVNWVRDKELLTTFHDQFIPYKDHGGIKFQEAAPYQGTVFRLPLRTMEQAATSMLSKRSMSLPEATSLLQQLQQESSSLLLFLKNVESIELSIWSNNQSQPLVISGSSLVNATQIRTMRSSTLSQFNSADTSSRHVKPIFADYSLHVQCFHRDTHSNQGTEEVVSRYSEHWEICNQLGGTEATPIAQDSSNVHLRLIPWGGVAALISSTAPERSILKAEINNGVAYCFLSLPVQTSLPVMCNGFFELSSNRRDVWQDGADMTGDGMTRAKWNISLMSSVISPCYVRLLLRAKEILGFSEKFQHLWPSVGVPTPWTTIVNSMLVDAANYPLMYVQYELGDVSTLKTCNDNEAASTVKVKIWNDSQWINCKEALFFPMNASLTEKVSVVSNHDLMGRLLLSARKPFVQCSASLQTLLAESKICGQVADAKYVRKLLRDSTSKSNSSIKIDPREFLVAADKLKPGFFAYFVSFCCDDLSLDNILLSLDAPSATLTTAQLTTLSELNSLPLLPLSNSEIGYLRVFTKEQHSSISQLESMGFSSLRVISKLFSTGFQFDQALDELVGNKNKEQMLSVTLLCSETERQLFSNASNILLNPSLIGPRELKFLSHPVVQRSCNLRSFDKSLLNDVLLQILPSPCTLGRVISDADLITSDDMSVNDEFRDFLTALWKYLQNNPAMISALSELYSILPVINVMLGPRYVPYSLSSNALATEKGDLSLPESILKLVESTGVNLVDTTILSKVSSMPNVFWNSIHSPSRSGLLQAMYATIRDTNTSFSQMTDSDRDHLRLYLGSCESLKTMSHNDINLFRALPLFCLHRSKSVADASVSQYSSLNVSNKVLVNESRISEEMIPMNYVTYLTPQDLSLLEALQVTSIKKADFFVKELLPNAMQLAKDFPIEYSSTCVAMLSDLNSLALENKDFINTLKSSAFLISSSSSISPGLEVQLYKPCELFDPMDKELRDLLDVRFFPSEHFYKEESLVVLRSLGLQTSIEWPGVIACAEFIASIDDNYSSDGSESKSIDVKQLRAIALLQFLQKHISRLTTEKVKTSTIQSVVSDTSFKMLRNLKTLFTDTMNSSSSSSSPSEIAPELTTDQYNQILVSTAWLPVMATPINEFIPWMCRRSADKEVVFATPNKSRPISDIWICSASFHICKETVVSEKLQQVFGWTKPVPLKSVAIQLSEIASRYTELSSSESNNINSMRQQITTLVPQLYQRLNECTSEDGIEIRGILESACWVWVGDKFVSVDKIAVITSINASPYLYQLPQDLRVYRQLMTLFQLKKTFSARDYVYVLRQMAADQASTESSLPDHLIDLAVSLATLVTTEAGVDPHNSEVYLPDSNGKLR